MRIAKFKVPSTRYNAPCTRYHVPIRNALIRPYRESDLDQLLDVWFRASQVAHPFLDEEFFVTERRAIANQYLPLAETWVEESDGTVIGFIALIGNEVGGLFVDPEFHGRGHGHALMDFAVNLRGELELDVFKENRIGRRFYERYGFEIVGERAHDETGRDLLRMRLVRQPSDDE